MSIKKIVWLLIILSIGIGLFAQTGQVTGIIIDLDSNKVVRNARVTMTGTMIYESNSEANGIFSLQHVVPGNYTLTIDADGYAQYSTSIEISEGENRIGPFLLTPVGIHAERVIQDDIPVVTLSESDLKDNSSQSISGILSASRDAFVSAASFNWGNMRFRIRGYEYENFTTVVNGAPMNDLATGQVYWGAWGGLNDVMRNRENLIGITASSFIYGGIGGAYYLDCRPTVQRKSIVVSYAQSNRAYDHRLMATYHSGLLKNGWALSLSSSRRWAKEGYVPGTFFDGYSTFAAVEKLFGFKHSLSITGFVAPTRTGRSSPVVKELYEIAGSPYYNPSWGYQNGKKRNANVSFSFQPVVIVSHIWRINTNASLETSGSVLWGRNATSGLDWYNAPDPRPDFYRRLPSFIPDTAQRGEAIAILSSQEAARQINWDKMYQINYHHLETVPTGILGDSVRGRRALYIVGNRVIQHRKYNLNTFYNHSLTDYLQLTVGATYQRQHSHYYQEVEDLLGGDFWLDYNQFAERDFPENDSAYQNDLNRPNRLVKEGEQYGYNYLLLNCRTSAWAQTQFRFRHIDFFTAGELSSVRFWREGKTKVGLFPNNSLGTGQKQHFFNYNLKGGITIKINGRNYLYAHGMMFTRAPYITDVLVSPRTRNQFAPELTNSWIYGVETGYLLRSPRVKGRISAFLTQFNNQIRSLTFYHEEYRTLVNYTLTNMDTRHIGTEIALQATIYKGFGATAVASIGKYYYTDRMKAIITQDNNQQILSEETVYSKHYRVAGTPEQAYNLGLNYRGKKYWFANIYLNVYHKIFVQINPARRTQQAVDLVVEGSQQWNQILEQEEVCKTFSEKYTIDFFGGKSWRLTRHRIKNKYHLFLALTVSINNITNNRQLISLGFEQLRFDFAEKNPKKFDNRYFYNLGTTYFINLAIRLN